jgi:pimeloyl-ACP methyl ester carboxylesterase
LAATVVLVPGAFSGSWIYWRIIPALEARGVEAVPVDLATVGASDNTVDLIDDVARVREVVDAVDGPVVLVGSSYGGAVITGVDHPNVKRLVYVAAAIPLADEPVFAPLAAAATDDFNKGIRPVGNGLMEIDVEVGVRTAFQQASPDAHDRWRDNARPMSFGSDPTRSLHAAAWETIPSTYVVCTEDLAIDVDAQRAWASERAQEVIEYPFDHVPGVSHPEEMADLIARLATNA